MIIKVNDVSLDCWTQPYPIWFHISQGEHKISFSHKEALAIRDALTSLIKEAYNNMDESHKSEVFLS